MTVIVDLTLATICFLGNCYPALVGKDTPTGEFTLQQRLVVTPGYGGDVLQYKEDTYVYAIHRVWTLNPNQRRVERLHSTNPKDRQTITNGCINVLPDVYDKLVECCSNSKLEIY